MLKAVESEPDIDDLIALIRVRRFKGIGQLWGPLTYKKLSGEPNLLYGHHWKRFLRFPIKSCY